jgi:GH15 family glucan-1,4-alpha-glucosidase
VLYCDPGSAVPSGTGSILSLDPASELAGYSQASLRDALSVQPYPALKAPGYFQTPLPGRKYCPLVHSAD